MSEQPIIGFMIRKAPGGGYELSRAVAKQNDEGENKIVWEVVTYRTRLVEIQQIEHQLKEKTFGEAAWYPMPAFPEMPRHHVDDRPVDPATLPEGMPAVVENFRSNGGMMGELYRRTSEAVRSMVPALFLAAVWWGTSLRPLVA